MFKDSRLDKVPSFIHSMIEINPIISDNFSIFIRKYLLFILTFGNGKVDNKTISLFDKESENKYDSYFISSNQHWHKIDEYFLQALYSDKVKVGMLLKKAIPIMSKYIYNKFE